MNFGQDGFYFSRAIVFSTVKNKYADFGLGLFFEFFFSSHYRHRLTEISLGGFLSISLTTDKSFMLLNESMVLSISQHFVIKATIPFDDRAQLHP